MNNQTATQQWQSMAKRINFIYSRLPRELSWENRQKFDELLKELSKIFGEKIAYEIEWKAGEK